MKLIITESQYKLLFESENNFDDYFPVSDKELNTESGISKLLTRYEKLKNKFGFNGIMLKGKLFNFNTTLEYNSYEEIEKLQELVVYIDGNLTLGFGSKFKNNFSSLIKIFGDLDGLDVINGEFPKLNEVTGDVDFSHSLVYGLPKLEKVGGFFEIKYSYIESLPELKSVGSHFAMRESEVRDLPKLEYVGGVFSVKGSPYAEGKTVEDITDKINIGSLNL